MVALWLEFVYAYAVCGLPDLMMETVRNDYKGRSENLSVRFKVTPIPVKS